MKLLRWGENGREHPGVLDASGVIRDLRGIVREIDAVMLEPAALAALRAMDLERLPRVQPDVRLGPCVCGVGKIVCIGLNYADHAAEAGVPLPTEPVVFLKATSAISGPFDDVVLPRGSRKTDWEVELGVIIGSKTRYVSETTALEHVAGYCVVNDLSEREFQLERGGQWDKGKCCDTFAPLGPWLVTREEIPDPQDLDLFLEVDGTRYQHGSTRNMVFSVSRLVSYVSCFMTLNPGDILSTGTPYGVGMGQRPPQYLRVGNVMRLGISGLGEQRQRVVASDEDGGGQPA